MSYIKGDETLPPELLAEIQKYVQGALVYIPRPPQERMAWGHKNGARMLLDQRDDAIRQAKSAGVSINDLADQYALSTDAIRKILYRRRSGACPAQLAQASEAHDLGASLEAQPGAA
ncbi:MAG TPA: CD3324 family protein [Spirochaetales bacterium]|nr:hypothetical protein [Spirochaetales bacterium]MBP7264166.1 hypothetical protein [Spirochaetia bacterium]HPE37778.1 CD3324 family protein [Spirochaetales bacterium]